VLRLRFDNSVKVRSRGSGFILTPEVFQKSRGEGVAGGNFAQISTASSIRALFNSHQLNVKLVHASTVSQNILGKTWYVTMLDSWNPPMRGIAVVQVLFYIN
jgi:hypothetical protein